MYFEAFVGCYVDSANSFDEHRYRFKAFSFLLG